MLNTTLRKVILRTIVLGIFTILFLKAPSKWASFTTPNKPILATSLAANSAQDQSCASCSAVSKQVIYAPIFNLPEASASEIVFNSRSIKVIDVTPTFYTDKGVAIVGETLQIQPAEIRFVDIKKLLPPQHRGQQHWGGMSLSYIGRTLEIWAQLKLINVGRGGSVDVLFSVLGQRRSNVREAVWLSPQKSVAILALGNSSEVPTQASLQFSDGTSQEVYIAPFATELIRRSAQPEGRGPSKQGGVGDSVVVKSSGPIGSLITAGLVTSDNGRFTSSIRFYDPLYTAQPHLFATNLKIKPADPHLLLKNTTSGIISARPRFRPDSGEASNPIELSTVTIGPQEIIKVDLSPLVTAARERSDLDSVSVHIINDGNPGSLIGALYSIDTSGTIHDVPLRDYGSLRNSTGAYPWRSDDDYSTIVSITNVGSTPSEFITQIHYEGGKYVINPRSLAAGETAQFDMRKIVEEQVPDNTGKAIPRSVKSGQFRWAIRGDSSARLIGRSEVISLSKNVSSSYSCALSCPPSYYAGIMKSFIGGNLVVAPSEDYIAIGLNETGTGSATALEECQDSFGCMYGPYEISTASWQSFNPSLATVIGYGTYQGLAEGETDAQADWTSTRYWLNTDTEECKSEPTPAYAVAAIRIGLVKRHAYDLLSETFVGGRYGYGIAEWTPACIGICSIIPFASDKLLPGAVPEAIQCKTLRLLGICLQFTLICREQTGSPICDP